MPYLDHAGSTLPSPELLADIAELYKSLSLSNPHSHHSTSRTTRNIVENARQRVLSHFSTNSDEYSVIFTHNATHSLKILAESFDFGVKKTSSCKIQSQFSGGSCLAYLLDSHNSVVGLREIVRNRTDAVICLRDIPMEVQEADCNSLFVLTAMSNFSGQKYDLNFVKALQDKKWFVCLDAAAWLSSSTINLSTFQPDFLVASFYKIFGYPTGLGVLLVKKTAESVLNKHHFAGGTVASLTLDKFFVEQRAKLEDRFEDGTQNFYGIAAIQKGFDDLERFGGMTKIQEKLGRITEFAICILKNKFHWNGQEAIEVYLENEKDLSQQGPIISFNVLDENGKYKGFNEVAKMADLFGVDLRTGCFCNIGACQKFLKLTDDELLSQIESGKECGDSIDIVNGKPTGAVRVSFGRMSQEQDVLVLEQMIDYCFINADKPSVIEHPLPLSSFTPSVSRLFCYPVKSCRGFSIEKTKFTKTGIEFDRHFMIISNDITLSQKKYPQLCKLSTRIESDSVIVSAENIPDDIILPLTNMNIEQTISNIVCSDSVVVEDCGRQSGGWLDTVLGMTDCRLRKVSNESSRSLSNEAPYLLVNEASVLLLADAIGLPLEEAILRFRPNIVVKGLPPFIEDQTKSITINNTKFEVTGKCNRCEMICVDQETGEKNPALIIALRNIRNREKMTFGIYLKEIGEQNEEVQVNDPMLFE